MSTIKSITKDARKAVGTVTGEASKRVDEMTSEVSKQSEAARVQATRAATDPTPLYAAVGLTDTVVERAREAVTETVNRAGKFGKALAPKAITGTVTQKTSEVTKRAEALPGKAVNDVAEGLGKVQEGYRDLAKRGHDLVDRVKDQQATKDLTKQVNTVVEQGRQLLGTASKGVIDTRSAAKATVTQSRRQAAGVVADVVAGEDVVVSRKPATRKAATKPAAKKSVTRASATKSAPKAPATRATATKPAAKSTATKSATAKSTTTKSTTTKPASKPAAKSSATKSTTTKSASKPAAKSTTTQSTTSDSAKAPTTASTAKRTVTTARNAAVKTADAAQDVVTETAKTADKAVDATTATASKVGD
ncbi:MAG TPA: hypothetical protein VK045_04900 [Ornithinicoccus sp.]|nr:hypothetical protein [Ornithinicoccus sp.]